MDVAAYLRRLTYGGRLEPTAATLRDLQVAHLRAVPFENLDIHLGRPIVLDEAALFAKIVAARRGGFCYELNGLFAWLLRSLGFEVALLSAGVARADGTFGPDYDHLVLEVRPPAGGEPWLADVGFGDSFLAPLRLETGPAQEQAGHAYRLDAIGDQLHLVARGPDGDWQLQYRFTRRPRALADYEAMCRHHQTSPASSFTQRSVVTIATAEGRLTLAGRRFIVTAGSRKTEREVAGPAEYGRLLARHFGIHLAADQLARLTAV